MSNSEMLVHRADTNDITVSQVIGEFEEPERLRLSLTKKVSKKKLDIGSWAYSVRGNNASVFDDSGVPVKLDSFVEGRRKIILSFLQLCAGKRDTTILGRFKQIDYFVSWLNSNGLRMEFCDEKTLQNVYMEYTAHLNSKILLGDWVPVTAANFQTGFIQLVGEMFKEESHYILAGAVKIVRNVAHELAEIPSMELYRDVCLAIARQCSDFVLENKSYPCVVKIRDYEVLMFPSNKGVVGPFKSSSPAYNVCARRISTVDEYISTTEELGLRTPSKSEVTCTLRDAQSSLDAANKDIRHWHRLSVAGLAAKAYAFLLLMVTGATPSEFGQFRYIDALGVVKSPLKKELSAVKFRAAGKVNYYNVGRNEGVPLLREYLKLREWILNGVSHDLLFFSMPQRNLLGTDKIKFSEMQVSDSIRNFYNTISGKFIDPRAIRLSPQKIRKAKSRGLYIMGCSSSSVAASLGHTEAVNHAHYALATQEQQNLEFGKYWQAIRDAADIIRTRSEGGANSQTEIAAGHCDGFNKPTPFEFDGAATLSPDCRNQYGCLYCEHYMCHGDEEDIHKLLSLLYVVSAMRKHAPDVEHAEALYKDLSYRIQFVVDSIGSRNELMHELVKTTREKVFVYGELTGFWEARLSRYEKMGVVF